MHVLISDYNHNFSIIHTYVKDNYTMRLLATGNSHGSLDVLYVDVSEEESEPLNDTLDKK